MPMLKKLCIVRVSTLKKNDVKHEVSMKIYIKNFSMNNATKRYSFVLKKYKMLYI